MCRGTAIEFRFYFLFFPLGFLKGKKSFLRVNGPRSDEGGREYGFEIIRGGTMKLLTVKEVSEILCAKPSTVYAWAEQGIIPHLKLNGLLRFLEDDIFHWIALQKKGYNSSIQARSPRKGGNR